MLLLILQAYFLDLFFDCPADVRNISRQYGLCGIAAGDFELICTSRFHAHADTPRDLRDIIDALFLSKPCAIF